MDVVVGPAAKKTSGTVDCIVFCFGGGEGGGGGGGW